jgi:hypothetical protein
MAGQPIFLNHESRSLSGSGRWILRWYGCLLSLLLLSVSPNSNSAVPGYNFCGRGQSKGYSAMPTNALDQLCKEHDICYRPAMLVDRKIWHMTGYEHVEARRLMKDIKCYCDKELIRGIDGLLGRVDVSRSMKIKAEGVKAVIEVKGSCVADQNASIL